MLFAVDVGNSHTVCGLYDGPQLVHSWRLQSHQDKTPDELALRYHSLLALHQLSFAAIDGFIIASVVPVLETIWLAFAQRHLTHLRQSPLAVDAHMDLLGLRVALEYPEEVGADRLVNAAAAWKQFQAPLIVIDFGTAITFDCVGVDQEPVYLGGSIHPGIGISLDALAGRTAKLPRLDINVTPEQAIGTSTVKAIHSGMLYGFGGLVDRMVEVLGQELIPNGRPRTVATGGMAHLIRPYAKSIESVDEELTLRGLQLLFTHNLGA